MRFYPRARRGGIASSSPLLIANILDALLPFIRNIVLVRLISRDDFGIAISLSVVAGMMEVLTDFGLPLYAVRRDHRFDETQVMGTIQAIALLRATILALLLLAASPLVASVFHNGADYRVYAILAAIVWVRGFENLGVKALMRHSLYGREALVMATSQAAGLLIAVIIAALNQDYSCMIWSMSAMAVVTVALSHALSPNRYHLSWHRSVAQDATAFGRPMLINGVAASFGLSDRLIVGSYLGSAALGLYNVAYGTAQLPRSVLTRFLTSAFLPLFVRRHERSDTSSNLPDTWAWCLSCLALVYGLGLAMVGDLLLALVFGEAYRPSRLFMALAGLSVAVKLLMMLPLPGAFAAGRTKLVAMGAILSAISVLPGAVLLIYSGSLDLFMLGMTAAEFCGLIVFVSRALREQTFQPAAAWSAIAAPLLLLAALVCLAAAAPALTLASWLSFGVGVLALSVIAYGSMLRRLGIKMQILLGSVGLVPKGGVA